MASSSKTIKDKSATKVGNYSQPGIHPEDKVDASGHKEKFDRGDPDETKTDMIQGKPEKGKKNAEIPEEYKEAGMDSGAQIDAAGHKKKFDRAAPEETEYSSPVKTTGVEHTEYSKPNYVEQEALRAKEVNKEKVSELSEVEFLEHLISKTEAGGWVNHFDTDIRNRIEHLKGKK